MTVDEFNEGMKYLRMIVRDVYKVKNDEGEVIISNRVRGCAMDAFEALLDDITDLKNEIKQMTQMNGRE